VTGAARITGFPLSAAATAHGLWVIPAAEPVVVRVAT